MKIGGIGGGGHARVLIDALRLQGFEVVALTDANETLWDTKLDGVRVIGGDDRWNDLMREGEGNVFIGVGSAGAPHVRRSLYERALAAGFHITNVIHPSATIASSATLGNGVQVLAGAIINAGAVVGNNVIVNTGAIVEHDCIVGDHAHIATGARLASAIRVGNSAHIGVGAAVRQGIEIGDGAIVGAGAAVVKDVPPRATVGGVPARVLVTRS
ncbi:MAG: acetyltransferase [Acidobacteriota bacterium]